MPRPRWIRPVSAFLVVWLTLQWGGPGARASCPMHAAMAVPQAPAAAHAHHGPQAPHQDDQHSTGCNCTWCPTAGRLAYLDTAVVPAVAAVEVALAPFDLPSGSAVLAAPAPRLLPFAIGPPGA